MSQYHLDSFDVAKADLDQFLAAVLWLRTNDPRRLVVAQVR
jgi:hypothetical protein